MLNASYNTFEAKELKQVIKPDGKAVFYFWTVCVNYNYINYVNAILNS